MKKFIVIGSKFSGQTTILKGPSSDYTALHKFTVSTLDKKPDCDIVELCECLPKKSLKMRKEQKPIALEVKAFEDNPEAEVPIEKEPKKSPNKFK